MQFQNPWGALAFALLIPLLLLYLLKQRYEEQTVPSVLLWDAALTQWEAAHPWQRWRKNLLFFLQAAAICLLALALMRPIRPVEGLGRDKVLLVDVSLSMQAVEEGDASRLDRAKAAARSLVETMRPGEEISLMTAGMQNEWLAHRSTDKGELLRLIDGIAPGYGTSQPEEALKLAEALYGGSADGAETPGEAGNPGGETPAAENLPTLHIFTDRDLSAVGGSAVLHNLARNAANAAVTRLSYGRSSSGDLTVLGVIQNNGPATTLSMELWADGALLDVQEIHAETDAAANVLFEGIDGGASQLILALGDPDALEADNRAHCAVAEGSGRRILLRTQRNVFLEKALLLREDVELYKSGADETLPTGNFQLLVLDGGPGMDAPPEGEESDAPDDAPPTEMPHMWTFAPQADGDWFTVADAPPAALRPADSPLARALFQHVDWDNLRLAEAVALQPTDPAAEILLYMGDAPLIVAREREGRKELVFGFDLHNSNLPLEKDFPILVQNALGWFLPLQNGGGGQLAVGQSASIPLLAETKQYDLHLPGGQTLKGQTQRQYENTILPGFYTAIQYGEDGQPLGQDSFAVNAAAGAESELRTAPAGGASGAETAENGVLRNQTLLPLFILAALLVLLVEWWAYHR